MTAPAPTKQKTATPTTAPATGSQTAYTPEPAAAPAEQPVDNKSAEDIARLEKQIQQLELMMTLRTPAQQDDLRDRIEALEKERDAKIEKQKAATAKAAATRKANKDKAAVAVASEKPSTAPTTVEPEKTQKPYYPDTAGIAGLGGSTKAKPNKPTGMDFLDNLLKGHKIELDQGETAKVDPEELRQTAKVGESADNPLDAGAGRQLSRTPEIRRLRQQKDYELMLKKELANRIQDRDESDDEQDFQDISESNIKRLLSNLKDMTDAEFLERYKKPKQYWRNQLTAKPTTGNIADIDSDIDTARVKPTFDRAGRMVKARGTPVQQGMKRMLGRPKATRPAAELNPVEVTMQVPNRKTDQYDLLPARIFNNEAEAREFARRVNGHITGIKPVMHETDTKTISVKQYTGDELDLLVAHLAQQMGLSPAQIRQRYVEPMLKKGQIKIVPGKSVHEGFQDFNRVEPYAVCLAGKPVKKFDYYEEARRFHDNWKKKLYREGNKEKADKITLMPIMDEGWKSAVAGAALAGATALGAGGAHAQTPAHQFQTPMAQVTSPDDPSWHQLNKPRNVKVASQATTRSGEKNSVAIPNEYDFQVASVQGPNNKGEYLVTVVNNDDVVTNYVTKNPPKPSTFIKANQPLTKEPQTNEAANPAQQAAIAIAKKKEQKPADPNEFRPVGPITIVPPKKLKSGETYQDRNKYWQSQGQAPIYKTNEAGSPAQQAAIAIAKKKEQGVAEDTGSWIVYDPETKQIKKRFKTHTAGKSYAKTHKLGFASSEYYFDNVKGQQSVTETVTDVKAEMARVYRKLAPKIERHRDSFLAGQLYDELENIAELHGAETEFKRMIAGARNRAHMDYDTNPGGFQNWFWYLPFENDELREDAIPAKMVIQGFVVEYDPGTRTVVISKRGQELEKYRYNGQASLLSFQRNVGHRIKSLEDDLYGGDDEAGAVSLSRVKVPGRGYGYQELGEDDSSTSSDEAEAAILKRIMVAHLDLLKEVGPEKVMQAVEEVAYNIGDLDEIGSSDVSGWVHQVRDILGVPEPDQEEFLDEKWSTKYKRSIDCSHPKGFSQRAHCAGRKK